MTGEPRNAAAQGSSEQGRPGQTRANVLWVFRDSPWLWASLIALGVACGADVLFMAWVPGPKFFGFLLGLWAVVGLLNGVGWSLAWVSVRRLFGRFAPAFWLVASLAAGHWLAAELGALSRLHGRYWRLAIFALAACGLGGLGFGLVCAAFQPTPARPIGHALQRSPRLRWAFAGLLLLLSGALGAADHVLYLGLYPRAHWALRIVSVWSLMQALVLAMHGRLRLRMTRQAWLAAAAGFGLVLATLNERQANTLQAFNARPWPTGVLQMSRALLDWDRDGYASLLAGGDCAPFDARIHPGAREIPDNRIDENCLLGDATRKHEKLKQLPVPAEPAPLDVVLITVDSLRFDRLGVYDPRYSAHGRGTSPNLDRWAQSATVFSQAYTPGTWTSIALPAMLRGLYPRRLHWNKYFETNMFALWRKPLASKLRPGELPLRAFPMAFDDPHPSLPAMLARRGMFTAAIVNDGFSQMLQRGTGLEKGFQSFQNVDDLDAAQKNDGGSVDLALRVLKKLPRGRRFFLWVHLFSTHWPEELHEGVRQYGVNTLDDLYDHEVAYFDREVARLLDALSARPSPVAVFITADHGEVLAGGRQHGHTLDEVAIRIPLIARVPGWPARQVPQLASLIDLVPTILALTRSPIPSYVDGIDLSELVSGARTSQRLLFSDTWRLDVNGRAELDLASTYDGTNKVILDRLSRAQYGFDQHRELQNPRRSRTLPLQHLVAAIDGYIEETGGAIDLSD